MLSRIAAAIASLPLLLSAAPATVDNPDPEKVIRDAMAEAVQIPRQAVALIHLAWPAEPGDSAVAARARAEVVGFGEIGIPFLRTAITQVKPQQQADLVKAFIEAYRRVPSGMPPDYLAGLEQAAWFGSEEARRVAIVELARYRYRQALLTIMDSAYEFPDLLPLCIYALGKIGDDRARFFLEKHLNEGKAGVSEQAAIGLAQIGGRALLPLKAALRSGNRSLRQIGARALLPVAGVDDISSLHEYVASHPSDNPETLRAVREATIMLEKIREATEAAASASSSQSHP